MQLWTLPFTRIWYSQRKGLINKWPCEAKFRSRHWDEMWVLTLEKKQKTLHQWGDRVEGRTGDKEATLVHKRIRTWDRDFFEEFFRYLILQILECFNFSFEWNFRELELCLLMQAVLIWQFRRARFLYICWFEELTMLALPFMNIYGWWGLGAHCLGWWWRQIR